MHHDQKNSARQSGAALLTALGLLLVFSLLGTAYLRYMTTESARTDLVLRNHRVAEGATGALNAAIGELTGLLAAGQAPPAQLEITLPFYLQTPEGLVADDTRQLQSVLTIADESQKVNLNHATRPLLELLLAVDRGTARAIAQSVPHPGAENGGGRWFVQPNELVTRGLMTPEQYKKAPTDLLTVYTAESLAVPAGYLNINAAPAEVMAAVLGVPLEQARQVIQARPFASVEALVAAAGVEAGMLNLPPEALALSSRCFRLRCQTQLTESGPADTQQEVATAVVEAVVLFPAAGAPRIRYWSAEHE
jgi:type II secretory pathway component PulK